MEAGNVHYQGQSSVTQSISNNRTSTRELVARAGAAFGMAVGGVLLAGGLLGAAAGCVVAYGVVRTAIALYTIRSVPESKVEPTPGLRNESPVEESRVQKQTLESMPVMEMVSTPLAVPVFPRNEPEESSTLVKLSKDLEKDEKFQLEPIYAYRLVRHNIPSALVHPVHTPRPEYEDYKHENGRGRWVAGAMIRGLRSEMEAMLRGEARHKDNFLGFIESRGIVRSIRYLREKNQEYLAQLLENTLKEYYLLALVKCPDQVPDVMLFSETLSKEGELEMTIFDRDENLAWVTECAAEIEADIKTSLKENAEQMKGQVVAEISARAPRYTPERKKLYKERMKALKTRIASRGDTKLAEVIKKAKPWTCQPEIFQTSYELMQVVAKQLKGLKTRW